jgi:hypothetical protein
VQPLLIGPEFRVTVAANGDFAAARLLARRGRMTRWGDCSSEMPRDVVEDAWRILDRKEAPVVGIDVIQDRDTFYLLDVNFAPSLGLHLAASQARDLVPGVLAALSASAKRPKHRPRSPH